ncbi:MAG: tripartite tricarboxylate transporter substrate binding protein [Candidatus Methylomirabilia bacterium]
MGVLSLAVVAFVVASALAQQIPKPAGYPERGLTIIVCYGAGGGSDQMARALEAPAERILGQPITVVNKPGGAGLACLPDFQATPADGYTILQHTDGLVTQYAAGKHNLSPLDDLIPLLTANIVPSQLYVNPKDERFLVGGKADFDKVLAYAKANPRKLTVANVSEPGGMESITMAVLERHFGIKTKQVSFDKPAERYASVVGGHLDVLLEQPGDVKALLEGKELLPVLTIWPKRFKAFPDVPATGKDYGLDWDPVLRWRALYVKTGTPPEIVRYLETVFKAAWDSPGHQKFVVKKNLDIIPSYRDSAATKKAIQGEIDTYTPIYKEMGLPTR